MPAPALAAETWAQIISYIPHQTLDADGGRTGWKAGQADLARLMRVSALHYNIAAPLLYTKVITRDLCHLLEGVNCTPMPRPVSKLELCGDITTIMLEYPDDTQLDSHITYAVRDALEQHRPNALKHQLTRASYARAVLRAALGQIDEAALVRGISRVSPGGSSISQPMEQIAPRIWEQSLGPPSAKHDEPTEYPLSSHSSPSSTSQSEGLHCLQHATPTSSISSFGVPHDVLISLDHLAIGTHTARTMTRKPDNFTTDILDSIAPFQVCCWMHIDDTLYRDADRGLMPSATLFEHSQRPMPAQIPQGRSALTKLLTVHLDPLIPHARITEHDRSTTVRRPLPVLDGGFTVWSIDGMNMTHEDMRPFFYLLLENITNLAFNVFRRDKAAPAPYYDIRLQYQTPVKYDDRVYDFQDDFDDMIRTIQSAILPLFGLDDFADEMLEIGEDPDTWSLQDKWDYLLPELIFTYQLVERLDRCTSCYHQSKPKVYIWD